MAKLLTAFYLTFCCLILSACASVASPTVTSVIAATSTVSPTAIPATVTITSGPSQTPSPTPVPPVVWAKPFSQPIELNGFTGKWSPTANEIVGTESTSRPIDFKENTDTLVLASAPAFVSTVLDNTHKNATIGSVIWGLDGKNVFYGIYRSADFVRNAGAFWSIARDGITPVKIMDTGDGVIGWMDARTLVFEGYNGGGEWPIDIFDVSAKRSLAGEGVTASIEKLHPRYVPMVACRGFCSVCVLPKNLNASSASNDSGAYVCQSEPGYPTDLRGFPRPKTYPDTIDTIFQDWQAGTNNMLILAQGEVSDKPVSRLLLWNVDTNRVTSLAPGGFFGRFSPDGKLLAYITSGRSDQYTEQNSQDIFIDPTIASDQHYLQIVNVSTRQTLFSLPVKADTKRDDWLSSPNKFTKPDELSFSPDGRYLIFTTGGPITLKDANFPTEAVSGTSTGDYLQIVDLQKEKLIQSLPDKGLVLWAPTSDKFICRDDDNWHLFKLSTNAIRPITLSAGKQFIYPAWSYDGSYLSFSLDYYAAQAAGTNKTFILNLIPDS